MTSDVLSCAVCYGDPDSEMVKGLNMGILALFGVIVTVLGCIAAFILHLKRRSKAVHGSHG